MSDHSIVCFNINAKPTRTKKPPHKIFQYKKANTEGIEADLTDATSKYFTNNLASVEENWKYIKSTILSTMTQHIPSKMTSAKSNFPWVSVLVKRHMRKRDFSTGPKNLPSRKTGKATANTVTRLPKQYGKPTTPT
jgi:hypothetical protein